MKRGRAEGKEKVGRGERKGGMKRGRGRGERKGGEKRGRAD